LGHGLRRLSKEKGKYSDSDSSSQNDDAITN
jgi:hypothetical protein